MEEDVISIVGAKGKHIPERQAYRHGAEATSVTVAGTTAPILRPRIRTLGGQEVMIESYELAGNSSDQLCQVALNRMLHGLSSRNYNLVYENLCSKESSKSCVSR